MDERASPWLYRRAPKLWYAIRPAKWALRRITGPLRATPTLMLIGAPRCSTTSMFWALAAHPEVDVPWEKEPHYFDVHHERSVSWYRAHFGLRARLRTTGRIAFEATPSLLPHPDAHRRVQALCPDAKLLVVLRDPVERAYSEWALFRSLGWEDASFGDAVRPSLDRGPHESRDREDEPAYLRGSRYADHLDRWLRLFGPDQLLVLTFDEIVRDSRSSLRRVLRFAGLDEPASLTYPSMNARPRQELDDRLRADLEAYFEPSVRQLRERYGVELTTD